MAIWRLQFRVRVDSRSASTFILKLVSKIVPRPTEADHDAQDHEVKLVFIVDADSEMEAHDLQSCIYDSLSRVVDEAEQVYHQTCDINQRPSFVIEFTAPIKVRSETACT